MKYLIHIQECNVGSFEVEADSCKEALAIAEDKYRKGEFVLEPGECQHVEFLPDRYGMGYV